MTTLSIITVTYNSAGEIEDFIESVRMQNESIVLWIIDNASKDNTVEIVRNLVLRYSWIKLIASPINIGLAAANNMPLNLLQGDFTAIVNPDVVLHPGSLRALRIYLQKHKDVVAVAPVNLYADGQPHTSFHRHWTLFHLFLWRILPGQLTHSIYRAIRKYDEQDVLFASGACLLLWTKDFQGIGGYDPEYFLAVEDVCDLCIRLRKGNRAKRVVVTPSATITHLVSRSSSGVPFILLWKSACGSIYHFHKHNGYLGGCIAYAIQFSSTLMRMTASWFMSYWMPEYRHNFDNNLLVLKGLINTSPLRSKSKGNEDS